MPLTAKGEEIKSAMEHQYGAEKGEQVFYASKNAGTISGVDAPASDGTVYPPGPSTSPRTGAPPTPGPWGGLPGQVSQEETVQRVNERSPWL